MGESQVPFSSRSIKMREIVHLRLASVGTRLGQSFGKLLVMSTELILLGHMSGHQSCRWKGLMCISTRPWGCPLRPRPRERSLFLEESLCPGLSWLILSQGPWTALGLVLMEESSGQTTLSLARVGLVTTGPRAIILRVQSWWTRFWMWFVRKLRDVIVSKASN